MGIYQIHSQYPGGRRVLVAVKEAPSPSEAVEMFLSQETFILTNTYTAKKVG